MGFNREPGVTRNSMATGGKAHFYLTDALSSAVAMADESGAQVSTYKYSPRGVRVLDGTDEKLWQPYQFIGGYRDDTGLHHFAARYDDPDIGRFTSQDPSGQEKPVPVRRTRSRQPDRPHGVEVSQVVSGTCCLQLRRREQ
ncbi:RHS repeat domain-containing protein [Streptomyces albidoflavus]|uniref:RHS repeat domain-containing protein n=2 Tax=Streptomyces TaxID=1883 RepID=UPI0024C6BB37|nr:RHS repeat-associated core domain-containing protein [Streptomyces albidoflavus]CAI4174037.1 hypothetical protein CCOS2040_23445 [Streptomyces albidoflavus]